VSREKPNGKPRFKPTRAHANETRNFRLFVNSPSWKPGERECKTFLDIKRKRGSKKGKKKRKRKRGQFLEQAPFYSSYRARSAVAFARDDITRHYPAPGAIPEVEEARCCKTGRPAVWPEAACARGRPARIRSRGWVVG